jgi:V/A-type H+-transporting ATPase subunit A
MIPPNFEGGELEEILSEGSYRVGDSLGHLSSGEILRMKQSWNIRTPRPVKAMLPLNEPLLTGQRVLDSLFPMAKGGAAIIPGGFGTGKTVTQQSLAKWCDADVIIYIGCGERGNEMTEVLEEFPELRDPRHGTPLMERVMLIANTSNMPVAAREASIYVGITAAEYFRDMGYSVALMADSTSRWAEALREISGRLEEMPGEEGYPAYLGARLAAFFERAGKARLLGSAAEERIGSVSVVNAVSPAGGDFSEPVTQASLRMAGAFWALDKKLAQERHFPSINWRTSYSLYAEGMDDYFVKIFGDAWARRVQFVRDLLAKEKELSDLVQLLGRDGLGEEDKWILEIAHLVRVVFLQQNAFDDQDAYSSLFRQRQMLELFQGLYERGKSYLDEGFFFENLPVTSLRRELLELRREPEDSLEKEVQVWLAHFTSDLESLKEAMIRG